MKTKKLTKSKIKSIQKGFSEVLRSHGINNHTVQQFALKTNDDAHEDDGICGKGFCFVLDPSHPLGQCIPCPNGLEP